MGIKLNSPFIDFHSLNKQLELESYVECSRTKEPPILPFFHRKSSGEPRDKFIAVNTSSLGNTYVQIYNVCSVFAKQHAVIM